MKFLFASAAALLLGLSAASAQTTPQSTSTTSQGTLGTTNRGTAPNTATATEQMTATDQAIQQADGSTRMNRTNKPGRMSAKDKSMKKSRNANTRKTNANGSTY
ncbi:hypothetical protein [Hymenobacter sp. 102]|uniref:hypothetical protein n=1 Tax=Hymenobacter sp. 102 TaxID=3403152 RepID=UPI003CF3DB20